MPILVALRRALGPLSLHRVQGRRRAAHRRRRGPQRPASRSSVAGTRYGKGSSREHSPAAEQLRRHPAGDRRELRAHLPAERRQHRPVHVDRLRPDRAHRSAARRSRSTNCCAGRDALAAAILRSGGLLRFGQHARARRAQRAGRTADTPAADARCSRRSSRATRSPPPVTPARPRPGEGALRARRLALHPRVLHRHGGAHAATRRSGRPLALHEPDIASSSFEDHTSYVRAKAPRMSAAGCVPNVRAMCRGAARASSRATACAAPHAHRSRGAPRDDGSNVAGISHAMMAEHYALPGQLVVGTDSHTPHSGALGCVAFGVGTTDMANAFVTGAVRLTMPQVLRVELDGALPRGRDGEGHRAAPARAAGDPRGRRRRQGVRVRRAGDRARCRPTSARRSPT